jgi:hypothetical protein
MTYCVKCGFSVGYQDRFCGNCGTLTNNQLSIQQKVFSQFYFSPKPSTNFANGFQIGIAATVIIVASLLLSSLNSTYWLQWQSFMYEGITVNEAHFLLLDTVGLMSFCAFGVILASLYLVYSILIQFNPTRHALMNNGVNRARLGFGLVNAGALWVSFYVSAFIYYVYESDNYFLSPFQTFFGIGGAILIVTGLLLLASSYIKSRNSAQKFKEQNRSP